jgi:hypothetical protein
MYMTRTLLTVAFDCMESHIEAHYHARSHASSASLTFFTAPSTHLRHDNLNAHIPWPNPPRHQRWQQTRWLRLPAQHHLNRGLQVLQRRPPRRSHLQCHPNHQMQLPTSTPSDCDRATGSSHSPGTGFKEDGMDDRRRHHNHGRPNRGRPRRRICHDPARVRDPTPRIPRTLPRRLRPRYTDGEGVSERAEWPAAVFCEKADQNSVRRPFRSSGGHSFRKDEIRGFLLPQV